MCETSFILKFLILLFAFHNLLLCSILLVKELYDIVKDWNSSKSNWQNSNLNANFSCNLTPNAADHEGYYQMPCYDDSSHWVVSTLILM